MARAAVCLGVREVAEMAGVTPSCVSQFETEQRGLRHDKATRLQAVFERLGVRFINDPDGRACVCYQAPEGEWEGIRIRERNSE